MKKALCLLAITTVIGFSASAQEKSKTTPTDQGNWMVGGSVSFNSMKHKESKTKFSELQVNPVAGYFVINNLALGVNADIVSSTVKPDGGSSSTSTSTVFGPFVRYYVPVGEKISVLADGSVLFGSAKDEGDEESTKVTAYRFKAGPAFFLSPSVALELTLGYGSATDKYKTVKSTFSGIQLAAGFQIFL